MKKKICEDWNGKAKESCSKLSNMFKVLQDIFSSIYMLNKMNIAKPSTQGKRERTMKKYEKRRKAVLNLEIC